MADNAVNANPQFVANELVRAYKNNEVTSGLQVDFRTGNRLSESEARSWLQTFKQYMPPETPTEAYDELKKGIKEGLAEEGSWVSTEALAFLDAAIVADVALKDLSVLGYERFVDTMKQSEPAMAVALNGEGMAELKLAYGATDKAEQFNHLKAAAVKFRQAIECDPTHGKAHYNLACVQALALGIGKSLLTISNNKVLEIRNLVRARIDLTPVAKRYEVIQKIVADPDLKSQHHQSWFQALKQEAEAQKAEKDSAQTALNEEAAKLGKEPKKLDTLPPSGLLTHNTWARGDKNFTFAENGSYSEYVGMGASKTGTWQLDGNKLTITFDDGKKMSGSIDGNGVLKLNDGGQGTIESGALIMGL